MLPFWPPSWPSARPSSSPLPLALVRLLSPLRADDLLHAATVTGSVPAWVAISSAPYETAQYLLTLAGGIVVLLVIRALAYESQSHPWVLIWPILLIGTLEAALGIFQAYAEGGEGLARGTYASRDHYAAMLEMILPFALMQAVSILVRDRKRHESPALPALKACVLLASAAVMLIAIIHSLSRMGFLAVLASLFVCGAVALTLRGGRIDYEVERMSFWRRWLPVVTVALIVLLGFIFLPTDPLIARFSEFARTDDISADTRAQIWRDTAGMVKAYPWVGCGWGAYQSSFLRFKDRRSHEYGRLRTQRLPAGPGRSRTVRLPARTLLHPSNFAENSPRCRLLSLRGRTISRHRLRRILHRDPLAQLCRFQYVRPRQYDAFRLDARHRRRPPANKIYEEGWFRKRVKARIVSARTTSSAAHCRTSGSFSLNF